MYGSVILNNWCIRHWADFGIKLLLIKIIIIVW